MVSICPLLWQRDVKLQQTKPTVDGLKSLVKVWDQREVCRRQTAVGHFHFSVKRCRPRLPLPSLPLPPLPPHCCRVHHLHRVHLEWHLEWRRCSGNHPMILVWGSESHPPTPLSDSQLSTQFSQEWARRKVVVKHSIKSNQIRLATSPSSSLPLSFVTSNANFFHLAPPRCVGDPLLHRAICLLMFEAL